jgi:hypothetical protein
MKPAGKAIALETLPLVDCDGQERNGSIISGSRPVAIAICAGVS